MKSLKLRLESLEGRDCPANLLTNPLSGTSVTAIHTTTSTTATQEGTFSIRVTSLSVLTAPVRVTTPGDRVIAFARSHLGQVVTTPNATGCAALAAAAVAAAGATPPSWLGSGPISGHYTWGRLVYQRSAVAGYARAGLIGDVRPGDIIQVDQYRETRPDGSWIMAPHHTAIVESVDPTTGRVNVIQQNWNGVQAATRGTFYPGSMTSGVISIYRPTSSM